MDNQNSENTTPNSEISNLSIDDITNTTLPSEITATQNTNSKPKLTKFSRYIESLFIGNYSDAYIKKELGRLCSNVGNDDINMMLKYRKRITEFDKRHFVAIQGDKSFVFRISTDNEGYSKLEGLSHCNFLDHYSNQYINVPKLAGDFIVGETENLAKHWLKHPARATYDGIIFYPSRILPDKYSKNKFYNEWNGFYVEPKQGEFPLLDYHFKQIWCCGDKKNYEYLMIWFADLVQRPERKAGIALVVKGEQGTGKSLIFENLIEPILGNMYMKLSDKVHLVGKFNKHLYGKLLLLSEEAIWAGNKEAESVLKTMITDKQMVIEEKGVNAIKSDSFCRLAFVSNEEYAVPASIDARRFFNIRASSEKANNDTYFMELKHEIENGGREAFLYYLLNLKYSEEQIRRPPRTQFLMEDIVNGMDAFSRWLYEDLLRKDTYDHIDAMTSQIWVDQIPIKMLEAEYRYFLDYNSKNYIGKYPIISKDAFTKKFRKFFGDVNIVKSRSSKIGYYFENIDKHTLRNSFEKKCKVRIEWDDSEHYEDPRISNNELLKQFSK